MRFFDSFGLLSGFELLMTLLLDRLLNCRIVRIVGVHLEMTQCMRFAVLGDSVKLPTLYQAQAKSGKMGRDENLLD